MFWLQQCLPFTVLKRLKNMDHDEQATIFVATVLTVYGIETRCASNALSSE